MKTSMFIPKEIVIGFQKRNNTYTGKLAYVIYKDNKNVLRKETSWNNWREKEIEPETYSNEPTSGFVLNKKAGGYNSGWNHRQTYIRVYDPRGYEFEITVANLLYILENTNSFKGKGLEGEFVYAWDGKDLILLPVDSVDYKDICAFNKKLSNNELVKAKDLILGATYIDKNNLEYTYLGRYDYYECAKDYTNNTYACTKKPKRYFFGCTSSSGSIYLDEYVSVSKKFIDVLNTDTNEKYEEYMEALQNCYRYSPVDHSKDKYVELTKEEIEKELDRYMYSRIECYLDNSPENIYYICQSFDNRQGRDKIILSDTKSHWSLNEFKLAYDTVEELLAKHKIYRKNIYLANGNLYN